jgi:hypothetical protein
LRFSQAELFDAFAGLVLNPVTPRRSEVRSLLESLVLGPVRPITLEWAAPAFRVEWQTEEECNLGVNSVAEDELVFYTETPAALLSQDLRRFIVPGLARTLGFHVVDSLGGE